MLHQPLLVASFSTGGLLSIVLLAIAPPALAQQRLSAADLNPALPPRSLDSLPITVVSAPPETQALRVNPTVTVGESDTFLTFNASVTVPPISAQTPSLPHLMAQFAEPVPTVPNGGASPTPERPASPEIPGRTAGERPSLELEPSSPGETPFTPTQVKLKPAAQFVGRPAPAVSIITPSAYGQSFRSIGVGLGFQHRTRFSKRTDGSFGLGMGFGDPRKAVGLTLSAISFSSFRSGFWERGTLNVKVNRYLPHDVAIAAGVNNGIKWGRTDSTVSPYGVVTKQFILRPSLSSPLSRLYVSAGVGGGQYRSESEVARRVETVGAFGSVALRLAEPVTLISEWSGQELTLGVSVAPSRKFPFVFTPAVTDIVGTAGNGPRFIFGLGYGFRY